MPLEHRIGDIAHPTLRKRRRRLKHLEQLYEDHGWELQLSGFRNNSVVSISHQEVPAKIVNLTPEETCQPAAMY